MEPIDRVAIMGPLTSSEGQAAIKAMTGAEAYNHFLTLACSAPAIDMTEAHGLWVEKLKCSVCGQVDWSTPNYCPNCGARMDGGDRHEESCAY